MQQKGSSDETLDVETALAHRICSYVQTCGGMVQFDWPDGLSRDDIGDNRNPRGEAIKALIGLAEKCARLVLPRDLVQRLRLFADYVTLGVDSYKEESR